MASRAGELLNEINLGSDGSCIEIAGLHKGFPVATSLSGSDNVIRVMRYDRQFYSFLMAAKLRNLH